MCRTLLIRKMRVKAIKVWGVLLKKERKTSSHAEQGGEGKTGSNSRTLTERSQTYSVGLQMTLSNGLELHPVSTKRNRLSLFHFFTNKMFFHCDNDEQEEGSPVPTFTVSGWMKTVKLPKKVVESITKELVKRHYDLESTVR